MQALNLEIREKVISHFEQLEDTCENDWCPRGDFAGCVVRLAGHDFMDFNPDGSSGGSDGCINFNDPDNKGLKPCLVTALQHLDSANNSLESIWQDFCQTVSLADMFVIASEALMTITAPEEQRGEWHASFIQNFRFGRETKLECDPLKLPDPSDSCDAVKENFVDRLGLDGAQSAALMGVHTLGKASASNSGFEGFWVSQRGAQTFDNAYYRALMSVPWMVGTSSAGKKQWVRADVNDDHPLASEFMLNTDMCLAWQGGETAPFNRAEDPSLQNCCVWSSDYNNPHVDIDVGNGDFSRAGRRNSQMTDISCECKRGELREVNGEKVCTKNKCCKPTKTCTKVDPFRRFTRRGGGSFETKTMDAVREFAKDDGVVTWRSHFMPAWKKATSLGQDLC